jgi:hypothetical protein
MMKIRKTACEKLHVVAAGQEVRFLVSAHAERGRTPEYDKTRRALAAIVKSLGHSWYFAHGSEPYDDHHGGGLWARDDAGWFFVRNLVGIEWSAQFCADSAKVDALRVNARRFYAGFPATVGALARLGVDLKSLLETKIASASDVARWTDSICNASVPLPARFHTGVLPEGAGVHNYPTPVTDIDRFRRDDFELWVR